MSSHASTFPYEPFAHSEIRIFNILPGGLNDPLCLKLKHVHLNEELEYIAISYLWGNATDMVNIQINSHNLSVTRSLFEALQRFRELARTSGDPTSHYAGMSSPYWFWADAICINQSDCQEKSTQIPMMIDIYAFSKRTFGWLGDVPREADPRHISQVFEMATAVAPQCKDADWDTFAPNYDVYRELGPDFSGFVHAWDQILCLQWFFRVWIVQEAVAAYKKAILIMESFSSPLEGFIFIAKALMVSQRHVTAALGHTLWKPYAQTVLDLRTLRGYFVKFLNTRLIYSQNPEAVNDRDWILGLFGIQLVMVSRNAAKTKATLPHDLIYAKLGIALVSDLPSNLAPDYKLPYKQVCFEYYKLIIQLTNFFIFPTHAVGFPNEENSRYPSWLPNMGLPMSWVLNERPQHPESIVLSHDGNRLTLDGTEMDSVAIVSYVDASGSKELLPQVYAQYSNFLKTAAEPCAQLQECAIYDIKMQWLTQVVKDLGFEEDPNLLCEEFERVGSLAGPENLEGQPNTMPKLFSALDAVFQFTKFIVTSCGLMLGINHTTHPDPGDIICILRAVRNAVCFRRQGENYKVIGVCTFYYGHPSELFDDKFFARRDIKQFCLI